MNPIVSDLRHLKLAELYEMAFESFVRDLALHTIKDESVRQQVMRLVPATDNHAERIQEEIARLNTQVDESQRDEIERAALLDIIEVEQAARRVYLDLVDKAHDTRLVSLFKEIAHEEAEHVRLAERILTDHDLRRAHDSRRRAAAPRN